MEFARLRVAGPSHRERLHGRHQLLKPRLQVMLASFLSVSVRYRYRSSPCAWAWQHLLYLREAKRGVRT